MNNIFSQILTDRFPVEKEIYRTEDSLGAVVVFDYADQRILTFDSMFEQSAFNRIKPQELVHDYCQAMLLVLLFKMPTRVTMLGLGGGSLLRTLHYYMLDINFEVVELRESVIDIASRFFELPESERVNIMQGDGFNYIKDSAVECTDIIFSDMFHSTGMDSCQNQVEFLTYCHKMLAVDGWLVINFHYLPEFNDPYMRSMCSIFSEVYCCSAGFGNYILFCGKTVLDQDLRAYRSSAFEFENKLETRLVTYLAKLFKISLGEEIQN